MAPHVKNECDPSPAQELKGLAAKMALPEQEVDHLDVQFRHYDFDGSGALDLEAPLVEGRKALMVEVSAWGVRSSFSRDNSQRSRILIWDGIRDL